MEQKKGIELGADDLLSEFIICVDEAIWDLDQKSRVVSDPLTHFLFNIIESRALQFHFNFIEICALKVV